MSIPQVKEIRIKNLSLLKYICYIKIRESTGKL